MNTHINGTGSAYKNMTKSNAYIRYYYVKNHRLLIIELFIHFFLLLFQHVLRMTNLVLHALCHLVNFNQWVLLEEEIRNNRNELNAQLTEWSVDNFMHPRHIHSFFTSMCCLMIWECNCRQLLEHGAKFILERNNIAVPQI
jgi:hypothetical protein